MVTLIHPKSIKVVPRPKAKSKLPFPGLVPVDYGFILLTYTGGRGGGRHFKLTGTVGSTVARPEKKGIILALGIWLLFLI